MKINYQLQVLNVDHDKEHTRNEERILERIADHIKEIAWNDTSVTFSFFLRPEIGSILRIGDVIDLNFMALNSPVHPVLFEENLPEVADENDWIYHTVNDNEFWRTFEFHEVGLQLSNRRIRFVDLHCIVELQCKFCDIE